MPAARIEPSLIIRPQAQVSGKSPPLLFSAATEFAMAWIYLLLAGVCEMAWPLGFKYTNGFRAHYGVVALTMATMCLSFGLLSLATSRGIHIGTAYAVWTEA